MEWNDETIAKLKVLWTEGLSTAEIGRRMGISKNAVVGKAHRLLLIPRPSPIRREPEGTRVVRPGTPRRVTGPTLPSLAMAAPPAPKPAAHPVEAKSGETITAPAPYTAQNFTASALRPLSVAPRPATFERRRSLACCWPIGEPGTRSFRFCDDESVTGKPYCSTHAALAYVKVRDRREDAA